MKKDASLFDLYISFFKIGLFTFGGGLAMIPMLEKEIVDKRNWCTTEEIMDYYAVGKCTPGFIAVNTATFIGQKYMGIKGGIAATLGVIFPSLIIIMTLAGLISTVAHLTIVQHAFAGIRVCVCILIFDAVKKLWKKSVVDKVTLGIFVVMLIGSLLTDLTPVVFIVIAGVLGVLIRMLGVRE